MIRYNGNDLKLIMDFRIENKIPFTLYEIINFIV